LRLHAAGLRSVIVIDEIHVPPCSSSPLLPR
jgi:hypothetical protein